MSRSQPAAQARGNPGSPKPPTRLRIQNAALELFAAKGFEATGIRDIAERAGVSTAALYYYMDSKEELLAEIMVSGMTQLIRVAREIVATAAEPASELAGLVRAHVAFHALQPLRSVVTDDELRALSGEQLATVMALRDSYEQLWAATLDRGQRAGIFHFPSSKITRLALLEMCNGVDRWFSGKGPMSPTEVADTFADLALAMVGTRRGSRPVRLSALRCLPTSEVLRRVESALLDAAVMNLHPAVRAGVA